MCELYIFLCMHVYVHTRVHEQMNNACVAVREQVQRVSSILQMGPRDWTQVIRPDDQQAPVHAKPSYWPRKMINF